MNILNSTSREDQQKNTLLEVEISLTFLPHLQIFLIRNMPSSVNQFVAQINLQIGLYLLLLSKIKQKETHTNMGSLKGGSKKKYGKRQGEEHASEDSEEEQETIQ